MYITSVGSKKTHPALLEPTFPQRDIHGSHRFTILLILNTTKHPTPKQVRQVYFPPSFTYSAVVKKLKNYYDHYVNSASDIMTKYDLPAGHGFVSIKQSRLVP